MGKKKKIKIIISIILVLLFSLIAITIYQRKNNETVDSVSRKREYNAEIGDITVGIDATGKIQLNETVTRITEGFKINKILVKVGDEVKKGDKLIELDLDSISKSIKELSAKKLTLESSLKKAILEKDLYVAQSNTKIDEIIYQSKKTYESTKKEISNTITNIENQINTINNKISALNIDLSNSSDDSVKEEIQTKIDELNDQKNILVDSLNSNKLKLSTINIDRTEELARENVTIVAMKKEIEIQLATLQESINAIQNEINTNSNSIIDAKKALANSIIYAQNDGIVLSITGNEGEATTSSSNIKIGDKTKIKTNVSIESSNINDIEVGQEVEFTSENFPSETLTGTVTHINYVPNSESKYEIEIEVKNTELNLQQGMPVTAKIIAKQKKDILTISNKAIITKDGKQYVKMYNSEKKLVEVNITTGFSDGYISEVLSGLKAGDIAIVED